MLCRLKVVLGTYAFLLPKSERDKHVGATHEWVCLLRAENPKCSLAPLVKKVTFYLHPSFKVPERTESGQDYYELTEYGWGEFQISCKLTLVGGDDKNLILKHHLKLYPPNTLDITAVPIPSEEEFRQECMISETVDELILNNPNEEIANAFFECLNSNIPPHPLSKFFGKSQPAEQDYINHHYALKLALNQESERLTHEFIERSRLLQSLIKIYYECRPDKALKVLNAFPQVLTLLSGKEISAAEKAQLTRKLREFTVSNGSDPSPLLSQNQFEECMELIKSLIKNNLVNPNILEFSE